MNELDREHPIGSFFARHGTDRERRYYEREIRAYWAAVDRRFAR